MEAEKIVKTTQEQAVGAWIRYLNQVRIERMDELLSNQRGNLRESMKTIKESFAEIQKTIIDRNRGGNKGMHGFIAEAAECGIGNARRQIMGKEAVYKWINDNGADDLHRGIEHIQQKFVQSGGHLSLEAVKMHLQHYPEYLEDGYKYQIPKDHYDKIMEYLKIPEKTANKMATSTGDFSLRQWKEVHAFFEENHIDPSKLEPSILKYDEVQKGTIATTFENEKKHLKKINKKQRDTIRQEHKPSLAEGIKATATSAAIEGATTFVTAVVKKRRSGKKLKDFSQEDWIEIAGESGKGTLKGGVRGASIYMLTNFTKTSPAVASSIVTASFGVAEQAHLFRLGKITEIQFIENAEIICLDTAISALSSFAGQVLIPIPVIGTVIGNAVGTMIYKIGKDSLSAKEQAIIEQYLKDVADLDDRLKQEYQQFIDDLNSCFADYMELLETAFDPDIEKALNGSAELAKRMGVPQEEILDDYDKIASYFLD